MENIEATFGAASTASTAVTPATESETHTAEHQPQDAPQQLQNLSYRDLVKMQRELDEKIAIARRQEKATAIESIRKIMDEYGIDPAELLPTRGRRGVSGGADARRRVAPKYRNPKTGATWSGRGKAPLWMAGQDREKFLIRPNAA